MRRLSRARGLAGITGIEPPLALPNLEELAYEAMARDAERMLERRRLQSPSDPLLQSK
jgi:hypothetical protein